MPAPGASPQAAAGPGRPLTRGQRPQVPTAARTAGAASRTHTRPDRSTRCEPTRAAAGPLRLDERSHPDTPPTRPTRVAGARRALLRSRLPRRLRARTRRLRAEKGGAGRRLFLILLRLLRLTIPAISILGHGHFSRMFVRSPDRRRRALRPALARPGDAGVRQSPAAPAVMRPSARVRSPATVLGSLPATIDHNDVPG